MLPIHQLSRSTYDRIVTDKFVDTDVLEITAAATRRWPAIVGVLIATLLMGAAGIWLMMPSDAGTARGALDPNDAIAFDTSDPSDATGGATTSTTLDLITIDPGLLTGSTAPWDAVNTTAPPVEPIAGDGDGYFAAISRYCMDDYTYPPCANAVRTYCSTHSPTTWYMPSLVGRAPNDVFTETEREHAHAYAQCSLGRVPYYPDVEWECTAEGSIANQITSQEISPGTPLDAVPVGWRVTAPRECAPPTTCVLITMPPNDYDVTTTVAWDCR